MWMDPKVSHRLFDMAVEEALRRCEDGLDEAFPQIPTITLIEAPSFFARAFIDASGAVVEINVGCIDAIEALWGDALQSNILMDSEGARIEEINGIAVTTERLVVLSLIWLILHELMHIRLHHLDLLDSAALVESNIGNAHHYQNYHFESDERFSEFSSDELQLVRPCLELQADNDATEVMFGVYAKEKWLTFRVEAVAIFVVMALMEKTEAAVSSGDRIYPLVATRFFTLFAQLFQYWLYGEAELVAGDGESFVRKAREPDDAEFRRYMKFVLALTVSDVIQISYWAKAESFLSDLGAGSDIFSDLFEIQYAEDLMAAKLQTNAAIAWRELLPVNEKFMTVTGLRDA